jgi:hypothetical protein
LLATAIHFVSLLLYCCNLSACLPAYLLLLLLCFDQLDVCALHTTQLSSCTCICFPVTTTQLLIAGV